MMYKSHRIHGRTIDNDVCDATVKKTHYRKNIAEHARLVSMSLECGAAMSHLEIHHDGPPSLTLTSDETFIRTTFSMSKYPPLCFCCRDNFHKSKTLKHVTHSIKTIYRINNWQNMMDEIMYAILMFILCVFILWFVNSGEARQGTRSKPSTKSQESTPKTTDTEPRSSPISMQERIRRRKNVVYE